MREMTSSPREICRLYSDAWACTCPLMRSTSHKVTVVVPMSIAAPHSGSPAGMAPGWMSIKAAGHSGQSQVFTSNVTVTSHSPSRSACPIRRSSGRETFTSPIPTCWRIAVCRRAQSSVWSSMLGGVSRIV